MPGEKCSACGYDLAGNAGSPGRCPECGVARPEVSRPGPRGWDWAIWIAAWVVLAGFHGLWAMASLSERSGRSELGFVMMVYAVPVSACVAVVVLLVALAAAGVRAICVEPWNRASGWWVLIQAGAFFLLGGVIGAGIAQMFALLALAAVHSGR